MSSQEQLEQGFSEYDWSADGKWQEYFKHVYPKPQEDRLQRMKRRWYKIYVDTKFDTDPYSKKNMQTFKDAKAESDQFQPRRRRLQQQPSGQQRRQSRWVTGPNWLTGSPFGPRIPPRLIPPQLHSYVTNHEPWPSMRGHQFVAWFLFFFSYITGLLPTFTMGTIPLFLGILRNCGTIFDHSRLAQQEELQDALVTLFMTRVFFSEHLQLVWLLVIAKTCNLLWCWLPIMVHGALVCAWIAKDYRQLPLCYRWFAGFCERKMNLAAVRASSMELWHTRHDLEVYLGFALLVQFIFTFSQEALVGLVFSQIYLTMRLIFSPESRAAMQRFENLVRSQFTKWWFPAKLAPLFDRLSIWAKRSFYEHFMHIEDLE